MSRRANIIALISLVVGLTSATTIQVEPRSEECFQFVAKKGEYHLVNWQVVRGGLLDINGSFTAFHFCTSFSSHIIPHLRTVKLNSPSSVLLEKLHFETKEKGEFPFTAAEEGTFILCLDNSMSRFTAKVVQFMIIGPNDGTVKAGVIAASPPPDAATKEDLDPMEKTVQRLDATLVELGQLQRTYRRREQANRNTAESTNARVMWYSLLVCAVCGIGTVGQVWWLKRWFATPK